MKIFVTGGSGFIGSHVVRLLADSGHEVSVLHLAGDPMTNLKGVRYTLVCGDTRNYACLSDAVKNCDQVFHLAAIYKLWMKNPSLMEDVNIRGTDNLLRACYENGVSKVVHTSSIAVYGGQGFQTDADEESDFALGKTGDLYCKTKYESELIARSWADKGLNVSIVNPCAPVGPGDIGPTPTGNLLLSAVNYPIIPVMNSMTNIVDVRDCARGHILAAEKGIAGRSYILGGGNFSHKELISKVVLLTGVGRPVINIADPLLKMCSYLMVAAAKILPGYDPLITPAAAEISRMGIRATNSRAKSELGFHNRPVEDSIRDAFVWFAERGYLTSKKIREQIIRSNHK